MPENEHANIRRTILNWLARRDHSQHEIAQKLKNKAYPPDIIHTIVGELAQQGLINEQRFTENYIYWRRGRGYGPLRISRELQTRGISAEMIAEHLNITDNAWLCEIRKVWQKHFKGKLPDDFKLRAKQMRFLQSRGFTREQIASILKDEE
jgi:regulatory protein